METIPAQIQKPASELGVIRLQTYTYYLKDWNEFVKEKLMNILTLDIIPKLTK